MSGTRRGSRRLDLADLTGHDVACAEEHASHSCMLVVTLPGQSMTNRTVVQLLDFKPRAQRSMDEFLVLLAERLHTSGWRVVYVFSGDPGEYVSTALMRIGADHLITSFPMTLRG